MEFWGWVIAYLAFVFIKAMVTDSNATSELGERPPSTASGELQIRAVVEKRVFDEGNLDVIVVSMKGNILDTGSPQAVYQLRDNSSEGELVQCYDEWWQEQSTVFFQYVAEKRNLFFADWVEVDSFPVCVLIPPRNETRSSLLTVSIIESPPGPEFFRGSKVSSGRTLHTTSCVLNIVYEASGYLDIEVDRLDSASAAISLAMAVALSDGEIDNLEKKIIKDWATKQARSCTDEINGKSSLTKAMQSSAKKAMNGTLCIDDGIDWLLRLGNQEFNNIALELCSEVLAADGAADSSEIEMYNDIKNRLNVDDNLAAAFLDKKIAAGTLVNSNVSSEWAVIGVYPSMSQSEIRSTLMNQYRRWNSRTNSSNHEVKSKSIEMLDFIARARNELLDG